MSTHVSPSASCPKSKEGRPMPFRKSTSIDSTGIARGPRMGKSRGATRRGAGRSRTRPRCRRHRAIRQGRGLCCGQGDDRGTLGKEGRRPGPRTTLPPVSTTLSGQTRAPDHLVLGRGRRIPRTAVSSRDRARRSRSPASFWAIKPKSWRYWPAPRATRRPSGRRSRSLPRSRDVRRGRPVPSTG